MLKFWNHKCDNKSDAIRLNGEISVTVHFLTRYKTIIDFFFTEF